MYEVELPAVAYISDIYISASFISMLIAKVSYLLRAYNEL